MMNIIIDQTFGIYEGSIYSCGSASGGEFGNGHGNGIGFGSGEGSTSGECTADPNVFADQYYGFVIDANPNNLL